MKKIRFSMTLHHPPSCPSRCDFFVSSVFTLKVMDTFGLKRGTFMITKNFY